jgi:hypothetical protein
MAILFVLIFILLFGAFSSLTVDQSLEERGKHESRKKRKQSYVCRYTHFNPNPAGTADEETGEAKNWTKGDCVVRAFCGLLDLSWEQVFSDLCRIGADCHNLPNSFEVIDRYANEHGYSKRTLRPQVSVSEFAGSHNGSYLLLLHGHAVCVRDNKVLDPGDCGRGKVKTYYEKGGSSTEGPRRDPEDGEEEDPVIRALCEVTEDSWDSVFSDLCRIGLDKHDMPDSSQVIRQYLKEKGFVRRKLPAPMTLAEFADSHNGSYLIPLRWGSNPDLTCVKDNKTHDDRSQEFRPIKAYYERKK